MKIFYYLFFILLAAGCVSTTLPPPPQAVRPLDIDLGTLNNRYIDFSKLPDTVVIGGSYVGDRIVFQNASGKHLIFQRCELRSTHPEDAIALAGDVAKLTMLADGLTLTGGGITFWGKLTNVFIQGATIDSTHTGIRATSDAAHSNVVVAGCRISNTTHEGIYLGVSKATATKAQHIYITGNTLYNIGWDAIQVGNTTVFRISENNIRGAGVAAAYGQDYGITVNPGSIGYIWGNAISDTPKPVQVLDSRAFFHQP